jgi:hypothetical protein
MRFDTSAALAEALWATDPVRVVEVIPRGMITASVM